MKRSMRRRSAYQAIKMMLLRRNEITRAIQEARAITRISYRVGGNGSGRAVMSDPTCQTAISNVSPLPQVELDDGTIIKKPEAWLEAIRAGFDECDSNEKRMLEAMFHGDSVVNLSMKFSTERSSIYRIVNEFIHVIAEAASYHQLIKTF